MSRTATSTSTLLGLKRIFPPKYVPALRDRFIKGNVTFPTETVSFDQIVRGRKLAPLVSPMIGGKPQKSKGGKMTSIMPAYLKPTDVVKGNRLLKRMPGEALLGEMTPAQRLNAIRTDILLEQDASCNRREEWMVCEVLKTGGVTLEGEDYPAQHVDFGRSPENNIVLSGADKWENLDKETSRQPLTDLANWASRCHVPVTEITMGQKSWYEFSSFECVQKLMNSRRGSESHGELGALSNTSHQLVAHVGHFDIYLYTGTYEDEDGNDQLYIDDNGVLLTSPGVEIYMGYGAISDVEAAASGIVEADRWPRNWINKDPSAENIQTLSAPIPVMMDADEACYVRV